MRGLGSESSSGTGPTAAVRSNLRGQRPRRDQRRSGCAPPVHRRGRPMALGPSRRRPPVLRPQRRPEITRRPSSRGLPGPPADDAARHRGDWVPASVDAAVAPVRAVPLQRAGGAKDRLGAGLAWALRLGGMHRDVSVVQEATPWSHKLSDLVEAGEGAAQEGEGAVDVGRAARGGPGGGAPDAGSG